MSRALENKRKTWDSFFNDPDLSQNTLRKRALSGNICQTSLRSVCWKVFLGYLPTLQVPTWPSLLVKERERYRNLKKQYIQDPIENTNIEEMEDLDDSHSLSSTDSQESYCSDAEIKRIIQQDVERTFPDLDFFRRNEIQNRLMNILEVYCKLNTDISYRQGMHELLAPLYWVITSDSLDTTNLDRNSLDLSENIMVQVLDSNFIEDDAYILFERIMNFGKQWYVFREHTELHSKSQNDTSNNNNIPSSFNHNRSNSVVMLCHRIYHEFLPKIDPILYNHLENFDIEPQLYGLRWIRLLFGREFDLPDLLILWDAIFSQDPTFQSIEYICLAILLRLRDQLLKSDYTECLHILMRPCEFSNPSCLFQQAKLLQEDLSQEMALKILQGIDIQDGKEPRKDMMVDTFQNTPKPTSRRKSFKTSNLGLLKLTKHVIKKSQIVELNKAIVDAMGAVHKNMNTFGGAILGKPQQTINQTTAMAFEFSSNTRHWIAQPPKPLAKNPRRYSQAKRVQLQMGDFMTRCISLLEKEIFENNFMANSSNTSLKTPDTETEYITKELHDMIEHINAGNLEKSDHHLTVNRLDDIQQLNESNMMIALVGLKHIRDILIEKTNQFDPNAISANTPLSNDSDEYERRYLSIPNTLHLFDARKILDGYEKNKPLPPIQEIQPMDPSPPTASPNTPKSTRFDRKIDNEKQDLDNKCHEYNLFIDELITPQLIPVRRDSLISERKLSIDQMIEKSVKPLDIGNIKNGDVYEFKFF